jgi:hypothetical protein
MTGEAMASWVAMSRAASNVPAKVEDETTLLQAAGMVLATGSQRSKGGDRRGPPGGDETGRPPAKRDARPDTPVRASTGTVSPAPQTGQDRKSVRGGGGRARR